MDRLLLTLTIIFVSLIAGYVFRQWVSSGSSPLTEQSLRTLRLLIQKVAMFGLIPVSAMLSLWGLPSPDPRLLVLPALGLAAWASGGVLALLFSRRMALSPEKTGSMYCCGTFTNIGAVSWPSCSSANRPSPWPPSTDSARKCSISASPCP